MMSRPCPLPETSALLAALRSAIASDCEILERHALTHVSTFQNEMLVCRLNGAFLRVLGKYGTVIVDHQDHGSRGCVPYEAKVYSEILPGLNVTAPRFLGVHHDLSTEQVWLFVEYLDGSNRLKRMSGTDWLCTAAAWAGSLHAKANGLASFPSWLIFYDEDYYAGWVERTLEAAGELRHRLPWLEQLCFSATGLFRDLLSSPTLIHGEFFPSNILVWQDCIYPVDWESAALGAGEIDLVTLTYCWPEEVAQLCLEAYRNARWPVGPPDDFLRRIAIARLYNEFRWLGARKHWPDDSKSHTHFNRLRPLAANLGIVDAQ